MLQRSAAGILCLFLSLWAAPCPAAVAEHAVVVVLDGIRASEAFDDPIHANVPRMWNDLRPLGAWIPEFRNDGFRTTVPGHASLLTGSWQFIPNDGTVRPTVPTLFEFFRAATGAPPSAAWVVAGKQKLYVCGYSTAPAYGATDGASVDCVDRTNTAAYAAFTEHLLADRPILSLMHLGDSDVIAHSGDWTGYLRAIAQEDSLVFELWMLIESDPLLSGKTAMFVTCDHGRHDDAHGGFTSHGDACEGCSRLPFLAIGPDFPAGRQGAIMRTQRDLCPTIGALMGFPTPGVEGQIMQELWVASSGVLPDAVFHPRVRVSPNPTSRGARFEMPESAASGKRRLRVWNLSGRLVHEAGPAAGGLSWDGCDLRGRVAAAGRYYWEIDGAGVRERGALTVLR